MWVRRKTQIGQKKSPSFIVCYITKDKNKFYGAFKFHLGHWLAVCSAFHLFFLCFIFLTVKQRQLYIPFEKFIEELNTTACEYLPWCVWCVCVVFVCVVILKKVIEIWKILANNVWPRKPYQLWLWALKPVSKNADYNWLQSWASWDRASNLI